MGKISKIIKGSWRILKDSERRKKVMGMLINPGFQDRIINSSIDTQTIALSPMEIIDHFPHLKDYKIALVGGCEFEYMAAILQQIGATSYHSFTDAGATNPLLELSSDESIIWELKPDVIVFSISDIIRIELKKIQEQQTNQKNQEKALQELAEYINSLCDLVNQESDASIFVVSYDLLYRPTQGILDYKKAKEELTLAEFNRAIEKVLDQQAKMIPNLYVLNVAQNFANWGKTKTLQLFEDNGYWTHYNRLGAEILTQDLLLQLNALSGKGHRIKCIVVDLDNTLWDGILRDDGKNSLQLRHDRLYILKLLKARGIMIAVCTKNDPEDEAIIEELLNVKEIGVLYDVPNPFAHEQHPYQDLFVAKKINWIDKAINIQELAQELNIGLDAFAFFDDNPFEREQVKELLPMVTVYPEWAIKDALNLPEFEPMEITKEAQQRTTMMLAAQKREMDEEKYQDQKEKFLHSCQMRLWIREAQPENISRVFEMIQRTNQLNMTTKRYSSEEIQKMNDSPHTLILIADLVDKYGEYGTIGLAIIRKSPENWDIDTFLFSCRAMGKTVEKTLLIYLLNEAKKQNISKVVGHYMKTAKNKLMEKFFAEAHFVNTTDTNNDPNQTTWEFNPLEHKIDPYPTWFDFI